MKPSQGHRNRPRRLRGEGTYWQGENGMWVYTMKVSGGTRSVSARTKKELGSKVNKLKAEVARSIGAGGATPLTIWARCWLDEICVDRVKLTTLRSLRSKVESHIIPALERRRLREITPEHVKALYRTMSADGYFTATIRQTHAIFSCCMKVAYLDGKIDRNPCENVEPPKPTEKPDLPALPMLDAVKVLNWLREERNAKEVARWSLASLGGLRQVEVLRL